MALRERPDLSSDLPKRPPVFKDHLVKVPSGEEVDRTMLDWQQQLSTSFHQCAAEEDHWYFDTLNEPRSSKRLLGFAESHWGAYTANSDGFQCSLPLEALEAEFQNQFGCQSWETVRPRIYSRPVRMG